VKAKYPVESTAISGATIILSGEISKAGRSGWQVAGTKGSISGASLTDTLKQIRRRIFGEFVPLNENTSLETVLLTGHAGLVNCDQFPGAVFGTTSADFPRDVISLQYWLESSLSHPNDLFPTKVYDWFRQWEVTSYLSQNRSLASDLTTKHYFYCALGGRHFGSKNASEAFLK